jgi:hypothetical protein
MQLSHHHGFWVPLGKMNKQLKHYWVVNIGYKSTFAGRFADGEGVFVAWATYRDGLPTTRAGQRF